MRPVAITLIAFFVFAVFLPITAVASFTFSRSNLFALNENGTNAITRTYDGLNRVTSYTENGETIGYRYYPASGESFSVAPDDYNFEMHKNRHLRNLETIIAGFLADPLRAGDGMYQIKFQGRIPIQNR